MKTPTEADFEVTVEEAQIVVFFKPTESTFGYLRLASGGVSDLPTVRHAKTGDTGPYDENEVESWARRLAERHARSAHRTLRAKRCIAGGKA